MYAAIDKVFKFINYWWFRYLMVTELYMVEKWEQVAIHIILAIIFGLFWCFNYSVVLSITGRIFGIPESLEHITTTTSSQEFNNVPS